MQLFVGLGNPGQKYQMNRHNIGFMAVDEIANANSFSPWRSKFQGLFCEGRLGNQRVIILKPSTFMNLSGQSVGELARFYKINSQDITVFHDELDLAPGKCRFKLSGGHAGHNGLKSIDSYIGENYKRIRLGIGHPGQKDLVSKYVLENLPDPIPGGGRTTPPGRAVPTLERSWGQARYSMNRPIVFSGHS